PLNLPLFFTFNAASWVLPDGPLLFSSAAAALCLAHATLGPSEEKPPSAVPFPEVRAPGRRGWWVGFGLCCGLALLSKYHGVFVLAGSALFLLTSRQRAWLKRPEPYLALLVTAIVFAPVLIWNVSHHWASFH